MFRFIIRLFAIIILLGSFIAGFLDTAQSMSESKLSLSSLNHYLQNLIPKQYSLFENWLTEKFGSNIWENFIHPMLNLPAFLILLVLSLLLFFLTKRR